MMNYLNTYRRYACDIGRINEEAKNNAADFISMTENVFRHDLRWIAEQICAMPGKRHVIMLSGPSSSGKTTSAKKLSDEFIDLGVDVQHISMDDFYLGREFVGLLPNGKPDFESVEALDIPLIKQTIEDITKKGECIIPQYDFKNSSRTNETKSIRAGENSVIIMEGIHALHPIFSDGMTKEDVLKVYVSVKQGIKDNEEYVLTNREIRFIRRLVRDYKFRKTDPNDMLSMWNTIVDGEKCYIRPYRYTSDFTVNSIHIYEPCVMKNTALSVLEKIREDHPEYAFVQHLVSSLNRFEEADISLVPDNSLIREFLGGGCYSY